MEAPLGPAILCLLYKVLSSKKIVYIFAKPPYMLVDEKYHKTPTTFAFRSTSFLFYGFGSFLLCMEFCLVLFEKEHPRPRFPYANNKFTIYLQVVAFMNFFLEKSRA